MAVSGSCKQTQAAAARFKIHYHMEYNWCNLGSPCGGVSGETLSMSPGPNLLLSPSLYPGGTEFLEPAILDSGSVPERPGLGLEVIWTSGNESHSPLRKVRDRGIRPRWLHGLWVKFSVGQVVWPSHGCSLEARANEKHCWKDQMRR